ncbi:MULTISPECIES: glycosyltransferase [Mesorhizobium]|uniref:Glycosyltransferase n=1 Tax=Mesorhizobium denitrificans TaxID=2294114 RepID=A0A371X409_9HYPH|nr:MULTISPECIES: glycosyltransferase [Mesorhizobium]RFC63970.1 glycosyltransferase [Mesorhizobium denitrificans]
MLISVVVPHLNQPEFLETGLAALHAQEGVTSEIEIIVVDNGSRQLPESICAKWDNVRLTSEPTPGPGPARNRGVALARGELLAFIDADCKAHPGWLSAIEKEFADPECTIIGGDVRVGYVDPSSPSFLEPYESIYSYRNNEHIADGFSGTGNLAARASVVKEVGPFAGIAIAEDRDWGLRAGKLGFKIRYIPDMIVYHPARKTFEELTRKWDRHIAHDYEWMRSRPLGGLKWLLRAIAVAGSPALELRTVLTSNRVSGAYERLLAMLCLARIRLYRGQRMLSLFFEGNSHSVSGAWNRK